MSAGLVGTNQTSPPPAKAERMRGKGLGEVRVSTPGRSSAAGKALGPPALTQLIHADTRAGAAIPILQMKTLGHREVR